MLKTRYIVQKLQAVLLGFEYVCYLVCLSVQWKWKPSEFWNFILDTSSVPAVLLQRNSTDVCISYQSITPEILSQAWSFDTYRWISWKKGLSLNPTTSLRLESRAVFSFVTSVTCNLLAETDDFVFLRRNLRPQTVCGRCGGEEYPEALTKIWTHVSITFNV